MKKLTATQEKSRQKKLKKITEKLQSDDNKAIVSALKEVKEHGDASIIPFLIDLFLNNQNQEVQDELQKVFFGLNDQDAVKPILNAAEQNIESYQRSFLLSAIWEAGLSIDEHLDQLTNIALKSDYMSMLEAVTIVENMKRPDEDEPLKRNIVKVKEYLLDNPEQDDKYRLTASYLEVLSEQMVG